MNLKDKRKKLVKFIKTNKVQFAQLAVMGAIVANGGDHQAFASLDGGDTGSFEFITKPFTQLANVITGPMAVAAGSVGAGMLGYSFLSDGGNQVTKKGATVVGGASCAVAGTKVVTAVASAMGVTAGTGFLF